MKPRKAPGGALWLLKIFHLAAHNPALAGDLQEMFEQGESPAWFWRQTLFAIAAVLRSSARQSRAYMGSISRGHAIAFSLPGFLCYLIYCLPKCAIFGTCQLDRFLITEPPASPRWRRARRFLACETAICFSLCYCALALFHRYSGADLVAAQITLSAIAPSFDVLWQALFPPRSLHEFFRIPPHNRNRGDSMKIAFFLLFAVIAIAAEKKIKLETLPAALQTAIKEQTKGATIGGISAETEKGKTTYEVETTLNGKSRDLVFDKAGAVLETEDEVDLDSLPAAAKAAIQKRAAAGTVTKVEKLTAGSNVSYEAAIKTRSGKKIEVGVNADGTPHKED